MTCAQADAAWLGYTFRELHQIAARATIYCRWGDRFLFLVETMSDRSGWYPADDGTTGKTVWAALKALLHASAPFEIG